MSRLKLQGHASGSGNVTLESPNTNSDFTVTVPSGSGTLPLMRLETAQTASGTSVDFTSIPSWVKRIMVMFGNVSTNGTSNFLVQLGTSGGVTTSGYVSRAAIQNVNTNSTAGFLVTYSVAAASNTTGMSTLGLIGSNLWTGNGVVDGNNNVHSSAGSVTLGGTLDRIRITTVNGTDTFDAGTINILYEG